MRRVRPLAPVAHRAGVARGDAVRVHLRREDAAVVRVAAQRLPARSGGEGGALRESAEARDGELSEAPEPEPEPARGGDESEMDMPPLTARRRQDSRDEARSALEEG